MKKIFYLTLLTTFLFGCKKDLKDLLHDKGSNGNNATGFIYTSTNSSSGNAIIALERHRDGSVEEIGKSPYPTGDKGDAAEGDFDTQWALRIVGEYLLAVNAGANPVNGSISVFKINKANGHLSQVDQNPATPAMDNMDSRGVRAASIAATTLGSKTWVVVGNQFANPNYQGEAGIAFGSVVSTPLRNLAVFTFNQSNGLLKFEKIGATYTDGNNGGPTTVEFNSTGTQIAVSTWGVPHFMVTDPSLLKQRPGRLYIYNFSAGSLSQTGMYEKTGVSGNIGISWSPNDQYIYMANFNLHSSVENHSLTVHNGTTAAQVQNFATSDRNDEGCWTWVSLDKSKLYVASFGTNGISSFTILPNNLLANTLGNNFFKKRGNLPTGDAKDMHETSDGYLYNVGAFQSHTVSTFRTSASGVLKEITNSPYYVPTSIGKSKEQHAYLGFTGFDKNNLNNKQQ
ncbi:MAG: hypothetical protein WKF97_18405 [Chitinophagaceae bacterium]